MNPNENGTISLEAQYLYRRGLQMVDQQKEEIALVYFRQAVFIAPGFSRAYLELGNCLARLGRQEEAAVYLMKASTISPVPCGTGTDGIFVRGGINGESIPGHFLTCLVR